MDQRDDMSYLKRYVQSHPDNRMAWYLLGKQYILENKEGKANYCFLQAGSIYEAYERKKHPLASEPQQIIKAWNRKRKFKVLAARTAGAAILLWLALLANPFAGFNEDKDDSEDAQPVAAYEIQKQQRLQVVFTKAQTRQPVGTIVRGFTRRKQLSGCRNRTCGNAGTTGRMAQMDRRHAYYIVGEEAGQR